MSTQNRWLAVAIVSVLAMITLLFSVRISPARDNNPFSGATSITVTMTRVVHHRHAVHQVYRAPVAWVPGFWSWRAVPLSPAEQTAMRGWRNGR